MTNSFDNVQELLRQRAELSARLKLVPYDGTPEIKENKSGKYLYIRKRENGKLTSTYVGSYSDTLYDTLLRNAKEARGLKKRIRAVEKSLLELGYSSSELSQKVEQNLYFARANMKSCIYDQAVLEGVATTFPQTETIIDNGKVYDMTATDVQKILNLKHAWEFILDKGVLAARSDYYVLCRIAKLVNEGFYENGGRIRAVSVAIGGSSYVPPLPIEPVVRECIDEIVCGDGAAIDKAIDLCLYCMKAQLFNDGNKRAAVIFANHFLISNGEGLLVIPERSVSEFKTMLVDYYEDKETPIKSFMKTTCWKKL